MHFVFTVHLFLILSTCVFQVKREEVDRRVKEDTENYSHKFSDEAMSLCQQVSLFKFFIFLFLQLKLNGASNISFVLPFSSC